MGKGVRGRSSSYLISYDRKRAGRLIVTSASEHRSLFWPNLFPWTRKFLSLVKRELKQSTKSWETKQNAEACPVYQALITAGNCKYCTMLQMNLV